MTVSGMIILFLGGQCGWLFLSIECGIFHYFSFQDTERQRFLAVSCLPICGFCDHLQECSPGTVCGWLSMCAKHVAFHGHPVLERGMWTVVSAHEVWPLLLSLISGPVSIVTS